MTDEKDIVEIQIGPPRSPFAAGPVPASVDDMERMFGSEEVDVLKAAGELVEIDGVWCWSKETTDRIAAEWAQDAARNALSTRLARRRLK